MGIYEVPLPQMLKINTNLNRVFRIYLVINSKNYGRQNLHT
jgi:hypothetical protein